MTVALIRSLVLVAAVLGACSSQSNETGGDEASPIEVFAVSTVPAACSRCDIYHWAPSDQTKEDLVVEREPLISVLPTSVWIQKRPCVYLRNEDCWIALLSLPAEAGHSLTSFVTRTDVAPGTPLLAVRVNRELVAVLRRGSPTNPLATHEFVDEEKLRAFLGATDWKIGQLPPLTQRDIDDAEKRLIGGDNDLRERIDRSRADDRGSEARIRRLEEIRARLDRGESTASVLDALEDELSADPR